MEVRSGDDAQSLAKRILRQEHELYADALRRLLTEDWRIEGRRILFSPAPEVRAAD